MKKIISMILVLCLAFSCITAMAESKWTNASDWAKPELEKAVSSGVYPTALENKDLTLNITRAEQAALTVKIYEAITGIDAPSGENPFTDTNDAEIIKAFKLGITSGTTETTFSPNENLTREQAAAMLARVYKKIKGTDALSFEMPSQFADHSSISDYAIESVYFMNAQGYIKGTEKGFEPQGLCTREQALAIAQRMTNNLKGEASVGGVKETYTIVCIGGSLTQGGSAWQYLLKDYFSKKMPDKEIVIINSGIGGTTSEYGAKRYEKDVLSFNPDFVIIDFAVNDRTMGTSDRARHQIYMESMVQQSLRAEKVPAIMFLFANYNYDGEKFDNINFSKEAKKEVAAYYNIPVVDAYEYVYKLYEADTAKTSSSYIQWLEDEKKYYKTNNVHPYASGYELFGDAIIEAFDRDGLDKFIQPVQSKGDVFSKDNKNIVNSRYNYMYVTDPRLTYDGKWYFCNKEEPRPTLTEGIDTKFYVHPYFPEGGMYTVMADAAISFKTNADEIFVCYISGAATNDMVFLTDGKELATYTTVAPDVNMNYVTKGVSGVKGKTVTIKAKNYSPLRIFAVVERFNP